MTWFHRHIWQTIERQRIDIIGRDFNDESNVVGHEEYIYQVCTICGKEIIRKFKL